MENDADRETSLKFAQTHKENLEHIRKNLEKNFLLSIKQKDILEFLLDFLILDNSLENLYEIEIQNPHRYLNEKKITFIITNKTKQKFKAIIEKFKHIKIETVADKLKLTTTSDTFTHKLRNEAYLAMVIAIFQVKLKEKLVDEITVLFNTIFEEYKKRKN